MFALVLFLSLVTTAKAEDLNFSHRDKQLHLAVSAGITCGSYLGYRYVFKQGKLVSSIWAVSTSLLLGFTKEAIDPEFSTADLAADGIGTLGGLIIPVTFQF